MIAEEVAYKLKIPVERAELVIRSFNQGLNYYLKHPEEAKGKIRIDGLCSFTVREFTLHKRIHNNTKKEYHEKILQNLQQNKRKNARQISTAILNERPND